MAVAERTTAPTGARWSVSDIARMALLVAVVVAASFVLGQLLGDVHPAIRYTAGLLGTLAGVWVIWLAAPAPRHAAGCRCGGGRWCTGGGA